MSTTLLALSRLVAKEIGYGSGTATAGTTTTLTDTSADSPFDQDDSESLHPNSWVKIEADSAGTPLNVGSVRRIKMDGGYVGSAQQIEWRTALSNAVTTTQSYGIYQRLPPTRLGLHKGIDEYINDVLRNLYYRTYGLLTLAADGDMEATGTTSYTTTNATVAKASGNTTTVNQMVLGKQTIRIQPTADDGGVTSANIGVAENQSIDIIVDVQSVSGTAKLQLYDVTNSTNFDTAVTNAVGDPRFLWDRVVAPSGCRNIAVKLLGTSGGDFYFDNLSVRQANAHEMILPSWITDPLNQVEELWYLWGGSQNGDGVMISERYPSRLDWWGVKEDRGGTTPYRIEYSPVVPNGAHLVLQALRPYGELSADTDTTDADAHLVKSWALARIYHDTKDEAEARRWAAEARKHDQSPRLQRRLQLPRSF